MSAQLLDPEQPAARWRPAPAIAGSIGLHCAACATALVEFEAWPWALAAVAANHLVLGIAGMWPRSTLLGPNLTRLPEAARRRGEIALTFDDGPDPEVTPRVLDILEAHDARATFFCIAERALLHPDLVREIVRRGHGVENHSREHQHTFAMLGVRGLRREIALAQQALGELAGREPRFFRPPAGIRNPLLDPVLHGLGLRLVTWTRRGFDTRMRNPRAVAAMLERQLAAGDILLLHDGHAARTAAGVPVTLEVLPRFLETVRSLGLKAVTLDQAIDS
jgi:peptidoglycan/xylan/chitin deacetylase (PgdA/CDA1 family)